MEKTYLSFKTIYAAENYRLPEQHCRIINEIAGWEIIGSIKNNIIVGKYFFCIR